jgi:hypothetical protein
MSPWLTPIRPPGYPVMSVVGASTRNTRLSVSRSWALGSDLCGDCETPGWHLWALPVIFRVPGHAPPTLRRWIITLTVDEFGIVCDALLLVPRHTLASLLPWET